MSHASERYWPSGTVYGTLLNFQDEWAAMEARMSEPPHKAPPRAPVLYIKTANTWSASGDVVPLPAQVPQVEVGATLAMVIGQRKLGRGAASAAAPVAGYVLMNDFSVPHASFFRPPVKFKCLDGFLGVGPRLVCAKEAGDPAQLTLQVRINGQLRQSIDFAHLVRSAGQLLADVAEFMTLGAGDVLMLGCGAGRPLAQAGDLVDIHAPGLPELGRLYNTLQAPVP